MIIRLSAGCSLTLATRGSSSAKLDWKVDAQSIELARAASRDFLKANRREILDFVFILFFFPGKGSDRRAHSRGFRPKEILEDQSFASNIDARILGRCVQEIHRKKFKEKNEFFGILTLGRLIPRFAAGDKLFSIEFAIAIEIKPSKPFFGLLGIFLASHELVVGQNSIGIGVLSGKQRVSVRLLGVTR